jgi:hypothetical protein
VLEVALRRFVRHVDAGAGHVELPAVVHTADARFLVVIRRRGWRCGRGRVAGVDNPAWLAHNGRQS